MPPGLACCRPGARRQFPWFFLIFVWDLGHTVAEGLPRLSPATAVSVFTCGWLNSTDLRSTWKSLCKISSGGRYMSKLDVFFFIYGHQNLHHVASLRRSPFQTCFLCCWMESVSCFPLTMDLKHLQVYCFYCPGLLCGPPECLSWLKHSFQAV